MGIAGDFFKALKDDGPMAVQMLRVHFNRFMLNKDQKAAYNAITATVKTDTERKEVTCVVPAHLTEKDAEKVLKVMELEYGRDWKVVKRADEPPKAEPAAPEAPKP
jgi:hypothetical protein